MARITSDVVKGWARELGADLIGIAPVERFGGAPRGHGPRDLVPESQSVIVAGIRIPDPIVDYDKYHLKFEEMAPDVASAAAVHNLYLPMGHWTIDIMLNILSVAMANRLEIQGGYKSFSTSIGYAGMGLSAPIRLIGRLYDYFSQRHAATRAGLGEFGFNNLVLTPEFGSRVRFVSIITEAELEPDPLITKKVCLREKCGGKDGPRCLQMCTPHAIQLREGVDHDAIFIDTPSTTEPTLCHEHVAGTIVFKCVYYGTCQRVCPVKMNLKARRRS